MYLLIFEYKNKRKEKKYINKTQAVQLFIQLDVQYRYLYSTCNLLFNRYRNPQRVARLEFCLGLKDFVPNSSI